MKGRSPTSPHLPARNRPTMKTVQRGTLVRGLVGLVGIHLLVLGIGAFGAALALKLGVKIETRGTAIETIVVLGVLQVPTGAALLRMAVRNFRTRRLEQVAGAGGILLTLLFAAHYFRNDSGIPLSAALFNVSGWIVMVLGAALLVSRIPRRENEP